MEQEIIKNIDENINQLSQVENEISMVQLAIYQKEVEKLKTEKIKGIRDFFIQQAQFYHQNSINFEVEINENIKKYETQINQLIQTYDNVFIYIFKIAQAGMNNQKIAIANIVSLADKIETENLTELEKQSFIQAEIACAQKKLNYSVMIEECRARLNWCRENIIKDINEVFLNNINQLQVYDESIVAKIIRKISGLFSGKTKYKDFLKNYEKEYLKEIKNKNELKIMEVIAVLNGVNKQMEMLKNEIALQYENALKG